MAQSAQINDAPAPAFDRSKYKSPPPPPASMTPPPSSQAAHVAPPHVRTPTPTHSHLSSPPPTVRGPSAPRPTSDAAPGTYTPEQARNANPEELRQMVIEASVASREARASAAHFSLQYHLLGLETSEAMKRMAVELEMKDKEVKVLQQTLQKRGLFIPATPMPADQPSMGVSSPGTDKMIIRLRVAYDELEMENDALRRRLDDAKAVLVEREDALYEENERLRDRIRENRKHVNLLRESGAPGEVTAESIADTPRRTVVASKERENDGIATLLEAGQALSQEPATAPTTPVPKKRQPGHSRMSQSLSSLPTTPQRSAPAHNRPSGPYYVTQHGVQSPSEPSRAQQPRAQQRRRESRDSTISASDSDEGGLRSGISVHQGDADWIGESPASQEAARILRDQRRRDLARRSQAQEAHSHTAATAQRTSGLLQSKLYGYQITKPGVDGQGEMIKRKFYDDGSPPSSRPVKKPRIGEGIGLGIAGVPQS